ncbi:protein kinase domain-containing protein [Streptomyces sp. DW26H14]|uniref:protein kinase domain-containing protein n=1 Tax=Streptomyces sp. DW26H14 TaxID=3435395 RepID=UPI00403DDEF3
MDDSQSTGAGMLLAARYRLTEAIGRGGMGRVWRAQDELLHRTVAVKELTAGMYATEAERAVLHGRTRTEARAAARITHPNVVTVHDVLEHDGRPWIVMQYVDGRSLSDLVKESGPVEGREAARIGLAVLGALRAAHAAGVLHRDVKPANVMLARDGQVLLADFGIAAVEGDTSVTRTGELIGSVEYLAPERVRGGAPGPGTDLWSLGATLYTAVQGVSPYYRESALSTLQAVVVDDAPYPSGGGELGPVIVAMLQREPEARPDADASAHLLTEVAAGRRVDTSAYPADGFTAPKTLDRTVRDTSYTASPDAQYGTSYGSSHDSSYGSSSYGSSYGTSYGSHAAASSPSSSPAVSPSPQPPPPASASLTQDGTHVRALPQQAQPPRPAAHQGGAGAYGAAGPYGPAAGDAPTRGVSRGGGSGRKRSRRRTVVLSVVAAVLVGGGIGYGATQFGSDGGGDGVTGSGSGARQAGGSTVDPTQRGSDGTGSARGGSGGKGEGDGSGRPSGQSLPAGWKRVVAPEGFSLWLPKGYVRVQGTDTIDYSPDDDKHFVRISIDTQPDFPTPLDHLKNLEGSGGKVGGLPGYHKIMLGPDTYRDQKLAARWKFTWDQSASQGVPGPRTAADLMYVDGDTGAEYALYMSGPTSDWTDAAFSTVLRGWQPPPDPGAGGDSSPDPVG